MTAAAPTPDALIQEARHRARRRRSIVAGGSLLALLAGTGIAAGLALSSDGPAPPPVPPGYHAVQAKGPVHHELIAVWTPHQTSYTQSGRLVPRRVKMEVWYDARGRLLRQVIQTFAGTKLTDSASECPLGCALPFPFERYWPLNRKQFLLRPGVSTLSGHRVVWLGRRYHGFAPSDFHDGDWIALGARTHLPVAERSYDDRGRLIARFRVVQRLAEVDPSHFWFVVSNGPPRAGS